MRRENVKEDKIKGYVFSVLIILVIIVAGLHIRRTFQVYHELDELMAIDSKQITSFKIYPRAASAIGTPIKFSPNDPIVIEFLHAITDIQPYNSTPGSIVSNNQEWFLEVIIDGKTMIQMNCCICHEIPDRVIGKFNRHFRFQSHQLFQWYQKYSHLWLNPTE